MQEELRNPEGALSVLVARLTILSNAAKPYVLRAMAADYEDFETVFDQTIEFARTSGQRLNTPEIIGILENVIEEGLAQAYVLSPTEPWATPVEFSRDRAETLWFYLTPEGKRQVGQCLK